MGVPLLSILRSFELESPFRRREIESRVLIGGGNFSGTIATGSRNLAGQKKATKVLFFSRDSNRNGNEREEGKKDFFALLSPLLSGLSPPSHSDGGRKLEEINMQGEGGGGGAGSGFDK